MNGQLKGTRKILAVVAAVILGLTGAFVSASPAAAGGGGCYLDSKSGWTMNVCSSNQGTQGYLDFYINANNNCSSCTVYLEAELAGFGAVPFGNQAATLGHHGPIYVSLANGRRWRLHVWAGILKFTGPWVWY